MRRRVARKVVKLKMVVTLDFKKAYKDLYLPKTKPMLIDVPEMHFIMIDGAGDPNSEAYQTEVEQGSLTF